MRRELFHPYARFCAADDGGPCACAFSGRAVAGSRRLPTERALFELSVVLDALGEARRIFLYEGDAPNAVAVAEGARASIVYNGPFLDRLEAAGGRWAPLGVLAHEVGHHVEAAASPLAADVHPWSRELAADRVSGFALARLGASLPEAQSAIRLASDPAGAPTHPSSALRLDAVATGFRAAKRR